MASTRWTRRAAVVSGFAVAFHALSPKPARAEKGLRVHVLLDGNVYEFNEALAVDLGTFKSEIGGFTQACARATRNDCPLTVFFRPDRQSDRAEIVFELGKLWSGPPKHLLAYTAVVSCDGQELARINVPKHFWFSRWRWQSAPRPVVADIADLIGRNLLPPYFQSTGPLTHSAAPGEAFGLPGAERRNAFPDAPQSTEKGRALGFGPSTNAGTTEGVAGDRPLGPAPYTIMGTAGITAYMGTTGERPDIGPVTEYQAEYIVNRNPRALSILRDQAEGAGTVPWHMRDEKTGGPVNLEVFPNGSWYQRAGAGEPAIAVLDSDITPDSAHQPALAYVPYLLTGDPYHLEDMQFAANWNIGGLPQRYRETVPQARALAWSMRTLAQCAKMTPIEVPKWLMPRSYWVRELERKRKWLLESWVNNTRLPYRHFHQIEEIRFTDDPKHCTGIQPWQCDFQATIFGWIVLMGFTEWRSVLDWTLESSIIRATGAQGWGRAQPSPYVICIGKAGTQAIFSTWSQAFAETLRIYQLKVNAPDDYDEGDPTYLFYLRGALVMGAKIGIKRADEGLSWANSQIKRRSLKIPAKWNFV